MKPKRWKPEIGEKYYIVHSVWGFVDERIWASGLADKSCYKLGNYFRNKREAQAKLKQIKKILKEK
jgi:hypothetical protein